MSPWNLSPSLHFGFFHHFTHWVPVFCTVSLWSMPRGAHVRLPACHHRFCLFAQQCRSLTLCLLLPPTPTHNLCSLAIKPTVIRPAVSGQECARPGGTLRCGSAEHERMSLKRVRAVSNWQGNKKNWRRRKRFVFQCKNRTRSQTSVKSKYFANEKKKSWCVIFFLCNKCHWCWTQSDAAGKIDSKTGNVMQMLALKHFTNQVSVFKLVFVGLWQQAALLDRNPTRVNRNVQLRSIGLSLRSTKHKNTTHLVLIMFRWGRIIGCCPNRLEAKERWTWQLSAGDSRTFPVSFLSCPWMLLLLLTRGKYSSAGRKTRYMKRNKLILESRFMPFCSVFVRPDWRPQPSGRLQEIVF